MSREEKKLVANMYVTWRIPSDDPQVGGFNLQVPFLIVCIAECLILLHF